MGLERVLKFMRSHCRGRYRAAGGHAAARRPKLLVERQPFLAPEAVIFGVDFTGPQILVVIFDRKVAMEKQGMLLLVEVAGP